MIATYYISQQVIHSNSDTCYIFKIIFTTITLHMLFYI